MAKLLLHKNRFLRIAALLGALALLIGVASSVTPRAAGSTPTSIVLKSVNTCGNGSTLTLRANGTVIGTMPASTTCTCSETIQTQTITSPAALAAVGAPGCTDYTLATNGSHYMSWAKVTINRLDGPESACIVDNTGRNCVVESANLCDGYQYGQTNWGPAARPDTDADGQNNCVDADMDNDGILNAADNCSLMANPNQADADGNGFGDVCDPVDIDGDGLWNNVDNCPTVANPAQTDTDGDGTGDACQPALVAVPWLGSEALPHQVTPGGSLMLQAAAIAPGGGSIALASGSWDPGDGAGQIAISVANPLNLELARTYTGSVGQPFTATIRVVTTGGKVYTDTFKVVIAANTRETRVNMAIDKGLWNLHKTLNRTTTEGVASGFWTGSGYNLAATASATQAFEINNHRESGDVLRDPYVADVARALAWITGAANIQKLTTFGSQNGNNPDGNGNGFGLWVNNNDHSSYIGGQVMDAIVASGTPNKVAVTGINPGVKGNTYKTIVQDLMDGYSWGMADNTGGWYYGFQDVNGSNDTSASHWWAIGVLAAHTWNLDAPQWVKNIQLGTGVPLMQSYSAGSCVHSANGSNVDNGDGHFGYTNDRRWLWDNGTNTTAAGLVLLNADGVAQTNGRFTCASQFLADRYTTSMGNFYTMYQLTKAMRTALDGTGATAPIANLNGSIDWYAGYADYLVSNQAAAGSFSSNGTAVSSGDLASAWAIIMLSPSLFELPPSAACSVSPATIGKFGGTVNFSAAASFHPDASATITGYSWNFGDGTAAGTGVATSHAYAIPASFPTTRNATVTVTDSNGNSATASCPVTIVNNNVPPAVTINGPYTVCKGSPLTLVGNATDEDGTITSSAWDLVSPINFSTIDATGNSVDATALFASKAVGTYDIGFRATDNDGAVSSIFSTVTVIATNDPSCNQPPVAINDNASTLSGTPVMVSVLANDTDPNNDPLSTTSATNGTNGATVVNGNGSVTYTPNTGFAGTDTFTYAIADGKGGTASATVTVVVTKRAATLTAGSGTKVFGAADPTLTPSSTGFLAGITVSQTARDAGENVSTYATHANATGATLSNYSVSYSDGSFAITKAPSTSTATGGAFTYDGTAHAGACSFAGVNSDVLTGTLTYSSGTAPVAAGSHTVTCDFAGNANYTASSDTATITIAKATASVTAGSGTKVFGAADPALTPSSSGFLAGITVSQTARDAGENVGTYATHATATGATLSNYSVTYSDGAFVITQAASTSTATGGAFTYDGTAHAGACSFAGVNGDVLTGTLTYSGGSAPVAAGSSTVTCDFAGNANYTASSDTATITIAKATASVTAGSGTKVFGAADPTLTPSSTGFLAGITVSQTARDAGENVGTYATHATATGATLSNYSVTYSDGSFAITPATTSTVISCVNAVYTGAAQTTCTASVTGAGGLSETLAVTYGTNTNVGTATGAASYAGDANHTGSAANTTFAITPAPSVTVVSCPTSLVYTGSALTPCTANVTGAGGLNQAVTPVTYTSNLNVGTAGASATYSDANHTSSTGTSSFSITQAPTTTSVNAPTIMVAANGTVTVSVASGSGTVLGNVSLTVDGGPAVTQALSGGSSVFTVASPNAGDHALVASYAAQGNFSASTATGNLHVNPAPTSTTLAVSAAAQLSGTAVTFTATVVATAPGTGTPNGLVTFMEGATVLGTGTLNAAGVATFSTTTLSNGPHTITAVYNGVNNYLTSTSNSVSKLIYSFATGGGTFVISDTNATLGKAVNFWGSQWEKTNIPTGGASTASFKGFAITPALPTVGATFTSAPGNSAPPPSGVAQYIGIIVTSKVTKSGSNITGTIVKLVVVKVDAGYQGNPGHAGTGTIVAFIQ